MLAQGTSFSFGGGSYAVTSVRARGAQPEIVDMTPIGHPIGTDPLLMSTGAYTEPATVEIELIGAISPKAMVGQKSALAISGPLGSVSGMAICEAAEVSAQVGDVVRGSARFVFTDG